MCKYDFCSFQLKMDWYRLVYVWYIAVDDVSLQVGSHYKEATHGLVFHPWAHCSEVGLCVVKVTSLNSNANESCLYHLNFLHVAWIRC